MDSMRTRRILSVMRLKKISQAGVARSAGVSRYMVNRVIHARGTSSRVLKALIRAGVPASLLVGKNRAGELLAEMKAEEEKDCLCQKCMNV